ncbi:Sensor protein FixL [Seminavis robusta]|uniref:Sensor protein FixL n=1 Tax=Seminavis robusta TaxID=568900 RepID=A0A9N8DAL9_9STRA|nr:Sensor protein FixL [Seminavis robusta]|eukprot:Sro66_g037290.1 Sensor protein FixL (661) ;mRNA; r:107628-109610
MATAVRDLYKSILEGSFDAGFLLDASKEDATIVHATALARELFEVAPETDLVGRSIGALTSFWSHSLPKEDAKSQEDTLAWKSVMEFATRSDDPIREWTITGKLQVGSEETTNNNKSFPGTLKLCQVDTYFWFAHVRHADLHDMAMGTYREAQSQSHQSSGKGRKRRSQLNQNNKVSFDNMPQMTVDKHGIIKEFNKLALNSMDFCNWGLIGKHVNDIKWAPKTTTEADAEVDGKKDEKSPGTSESLGVVFDLTQDAEEGTGGLGLIQIGNKDNTVATTGGYNRDEVITEAVFEAALNPLFQINEHGTIQMVNSAAEKVFGWTRNEFLGSNIAMICGGEHGPKHASYIERYLATGDTRVIGKNRELIAKRKDGSEFPIELGVVEVDTFSGDTRLFCGFVRDLSRIKRREQLTKEIVEGSLDPMFHINQSGRILMVNQAALTAFGYEREELEGHNISMICGGSHGKHHDSYIKKYLETGDTQVIGKQRELPARRKDGSEYPIQLAVVELEPGPDGERMFCGYVHDLSQRKRNEDIIRGTIDTSLDPVLHIDINGIIQSVNRAALDHLGWTRSELVGQNVSMIVGGGHAEHHDEYLKKYLETGEAKAMGRRRKLKARRQDGSEMDIELKLSEINIDGGKERMFCAFLTDLAQFGMDESRTSC